MRNKTQPIWALLLLSSSGVFAQATENAVTGASDAFGFSNGDESVGIYNEQSVRGFNLEASGNYRINGRYFVKSSGTSNFFLEAKTVRIGYNTFGVSLPGPSGVVDFKLRDPAAGAPSLLTAGLAGHTSPYMDFLYRHRSPGGNFSAAGGIGIEYDQQDHQGGKSSSWLVAGTARINIGDRTKIQIFGGEYSYRRQSQFRVRTNDTLPPSRIKRGQFLGQNWAVEEGERRIAGLLWDHKTDSDWEIEGITVFSQDDPTTAFSQLITLAEDGSEAESTLITSPHQKFTAWSGELTVGKNFRVGNSHHKMKVIGRWRRSRNRFGGDEALYIGSSLFGAVPTAHAEIINTNNAHLTGAVNQVGFGIAYNMNWDNKLKVAAGLLRSDYKKTFFSGQSENVNSSKPWLYNVGVSTRIGADIDLYGSYSRGLEESGTAPSSAANANAVLNAVIVTQREIGIKANLSDNVNFVIAGFDTRKPYAGLDKTSNIYGLTGNVRHRGIEASLSGQIAKGLSVIFGGVIMEAHLETVAQTEQIMDQRPVAVPSSRLIANLNYQIPGNSDLSVDIGVESVGKQAASSRLVGSEQLNLPRQTTVDAGLRYKFSLGGQAATLRFQAQNLFNTFFWKVNSAETFDYNERRRFRLVVTTEF